MNLSHPLDDLVGKNAARVLERLALVESGLTGRRLAELSETPVGSAQRALARLEHVGLVLSQQAGRARLYSLNRNHLLWIALSDALRSQELLEHRIAEVTRDIGGVSTTVAIYGSTARNRATAESDIDVIILWGESIGEGRRDELLALLNSEISDLTGNSAEFVDLTEADLKRLITADDPLVTSLKRDARTLSGPDLLTRIEQIAA